MPIYTRIALFYRLLRLTNGVILIRLLPHSRWFERLSSLLILSALPATADP